MSLFLLNPLSLFSWSQRSHMKLSSHTIMRWQRTVRVEITSDPGSSGTVAHARACCSHLTHEWPELWEVEFDSL